MLTATVKGKTLSHDSKGERMRGNSISHILIKIFIKGLVHSCSRTVRKMFDSFILSVMIN